MAEHPDKSVQYHIEVQHGFTADKLDGGVMVVLDLDGQDLPESVAQTILELATSTEQHYGFSCGDQYLKTGDKKMPETGINLITTEIPSSSGSIRNGASETVDIKVNKNISRQPKELDVPKMDVESRSDIKDISSDCEYPYSTNIRVDAATQCELSLRDLSTENSQVRESNDDISGSPEQWMKHETESMENHSSSPPPPPPPPPSHDLHGSTPLKMTCKHCDFSSESALDLGRHTKREHRDKMPFRCFHCCKEFGQELSLHIHSLSHDESSFRPSRKGCYSCPVCDFYCRLKGQLLGHIKDDHRKCQIHTCDLCRFACLSLEQLTDHNLSARHGRNKNKLSVCSVCCTPCRSLSDHVATFHSSERPFLCTQCGHKTKTEGSLKTHMLIHTDKRDFVCLTCKTAFKSISRLNRHQKVHNPVKKFLCSQCAFATNDSYDYKRHVLRVHSRKDFYTCKECGATFFKTSQLKLHAMVEHKSKYAFYCEYCDFSSVGRLEFREHMEEHTGKHRFFCHSCDFTTPWKCHYDRHMNIHLGVKPFVCEVCNYSCSEKVNLKKHMVVHSNEKPFACDQCGYKCKLKNMLNSHMRVVHSDLKPFACDTCDYTTKTSGNLRKHVWIHNQYKPYQCPQCPYACRESSKLRRHQSNKHHNLLSKVEAVAVKLANPTSIVNADLLNLPKPET